MFVSWSIIQASPTIYSTTPHSQSTTTHPPPFSSTTALFFNSPPTTSSSSPPPHSFVRGWRAVVVWHRLYGVTYYTTTTTTDCKSCCSLFPPLSSSSSQLPCTTQRMRLCMSPFPLFLCQPPTPQLLRICAWHVYNVSSWLWHHHHRIETSS